MNDDLDRFGILFTGIFMGGIIEFTGIKGLSFIVFGVGIGGVLFLDWFISRERKVGGKRNG